MGVWVGVGVRVRVMVGVWVMVGVVRERVGGVRVMVGCGEREGRVRGRMRVG